MPEFEATHLNLWLGCGSEEQHIIQWEVFAVAKFREIAVFALEQTFTVYIFVFTGQGNRPYLHVSRLLALFEKHQPLRHGISH